MLQIASGIYFKTEDLYETVHRRVYYTNGLRGRAEDIDLPIGTLRFTSGHGEVQPVVVEAIDRLEKTDPDGSPSPHIATGGDELVDDVVDVVAFGLDVVALSDPDLARRVVAGGAPGRRRRQKLLRHVLEPTRFISDAEIDDLRALCTDLLALQRSYFEAVMRAIRRVADAVAFADSDVTLSYTLFVAALESLAKEAPAPESTWENYDSRKRKIIDAACSEIGEDGTAKVRAAVLEIDMLALRRKFQGFVLDHIGEEFYRLDAINSSNPIRAVELPKALDFAYQVRSKTVHELRDLAPELRELAQQDDTVWHEGMTVLSLEGLHRVCQHVIRQYIKRAPVGVDPDFQQRYRSAIPGIVRVRASPELWLPQYSNFAASECPRIFSALVESMHSVARGDADGVVDLRIPLQQIEVLLPGEAKDPRRVPMIAIYLLWHAMVAEELERPDAQKYLDPYVHLLDAPSMFSYAIWAFGGQFTWAESELAMLADEREAALRQQSKSVLELPDRLDATLRVDLAQRAWDRDDRTGCLAQLEKAIWLLPGDEQLILWELGVLQDGVFPEVNLRAFFIGRTDEADPEKEKPA
ncbi:hypothetical protein [Microbacterium sp. MM2322]|uniref:hypothetical protein n=1 Tax=Microbacterium sp. MM2322 TaxID=3157631 RepID=UPI0032D58047